jgi:hypothetical protein
LPQDVIGCWTIDGYNIFKTTAAIVIGKSDEGPNQVDLKGLTILKDTEIQVGGRPARRIDFQNKNEPGGTVLPYSQARGIGVMMKAPEADGKYLTFVFVSTPDQWDKLSPLFEASLQSITLDGKGGSSTESNTIKTVFLESEKERPLTGATVIIGRQLHLIPVSQVPTGDFGSGISRIGTGGPIDVVRGEAIFQIGTTDDKGIYRPTGLPPGEYQVVVWKMGHVPSQNLKFTVPGGGLKVFASPDTAPGMQNRHRTLDTSKIFSMKPPDPNQPCIWGRITIGTRTTVTPNTDPVAGEGVTILVGANLSLAGPGRIPSDIDVVQGDVIYAEVKTQADGTFRIPLPPGQYSLLIWKEGCIPQTRVNVLVWPGQVFYTLLQDNQPGRPRLHQFLDTTANNIPRRAIDPRPGIRGVIRVTDQGIRKPAADVTILVGTDLVLDQPQIPNPVDKVIGTRLIAQTKTNQHGEYFVPVPPGSYRLIVWKQGHIPEFIDIVQVPPGVYNTTLMVDNQVGSSGRHQQLDFSGLKEPPTTSGKPANSTGNSVGKDGVPKQSPPEEEQAEEPPASTAVLPVLLLGLPPELTARTAGNITLSVPADWRTDLDTPSDEGAWLVGKLDNPEAAFSILRDVAFDRLAALIAPKGTPTTVGNRPALSYTGPLRSEPGTQARLVVLTDPEADGRRIAFLARAHESKWTDYLPTFDAILTSIKFTSAGTNPNTPTTATKPTTPPPVVASTLKELVKVARIPDFAAAVAYTAYEDRVLFTNADNKTAAIGVAGRGKAIGAAFRDYLAAEPAVAALLGEAVSLEMTVLGNTLVAQVFEGGTLVQEKASGKMWWNLHNKRPRDLRPAEELTRYPQVLFNGRYYEISTFPQRVRIADLAAQAEIAVQVGSPGRSIPPDFRKVIDDAKLETSLGRAVSDPEPLFDTPARVQVYEGGVVIVEPGTDRSWWCRHTKRSLPPTKPVVSLPKDPNAVVVQLDYVGGHTLPRKTNDPFLRIRADGRVTLIDPFGQLKPVETKIASDNLLAFLKFALEEHNFFALETLSLERAIQDEARRRKLPTIVDLPTTVVKIQTADRTHEVRCYAPEFYAEQLPGLQPVQHFQAIHQRLARYMESLRGP